jgi:hypothetical protein
LLPVIEMNRYPQEGDRLRLDLYRAGKPFRDVPPAP